MNPLYTQNQDWFPSVHDRFNRMSLRVCADVSEESGRELIALCEFVFPFYRENQASSRQIAR